MALPFIDDIGGTIRGYRIFTACRTANGKLFRLEDHLDRLYQSAAAIYMPPPMERDHLAALLVEIVKKNLEENSCQDLVLDIIFSGGLKGASMKPSGKRAHLYVAVTEMIPPSPEYYGNGVGLATYIHQRVCPEVKLLNYIGAVLAHHTVVPQFDAFEALFLSPPDGAKVLEGSTFAIFFVNKKGELVTPPLDGTILDSVTRRVLLQLLSTRKDIQAREEVIPAKDIFSFPESFLISTTRNVLPVTRIDGRVIGDGKPGPVTKTIMRLLEDYVRSY